MCHRRWDETAGGCTGCVLNRSSEHGRCRVVTCWRVDMFRVKITRAGAMWVRVVVRQRQLSIDYRPTPLSQRMTHTLDDSTMPPVSVSPSCGSNARRGRAQASCTQLHAHSGCGTRGQLHTSLHTILSENVLTLLSGAVSAPLAKSTNTCDPGLSRGVIARGAHTPAFPSAAAQETM